MKPQTDGAPAAVGSSPALPMAAAAGSGPLVAGAVRRGAVGRLVLTQFRSYASARWEGGPDPVVLTGPNGAGKTNLLEALSLLAPGRGLRSARLPDLARSGLDRAPESDGWAISARVWSGPVSIDIGTGCGALAGAAPGSDRRVVRLDDRVGRSADLSYHLAMQWLTPAMDRLFQDGSGERRRFLDRMVYGVDPSHAGRLTRYERALRERSRLLREGRADAAWLDGLEDQMVTAGVAIAAARRDLVRRLAGALASAPGPFPRAGVQLEGRIDDLLAPGPALAAEDELRDELRVGRGQDSVSGGAAVGPHRSDLKVWFPGSGGGLDRPAGQCSTGEQKALLISLVLANARLLIADRQATPILLLDEVVAHLDRDRRQALFDQLLSLDLQAWLTGTDATLFEPMQGRARFVRIDPGRIGTD